MCRWLLESCCTKSYGNAGKKRRMEDEVPPCPRCPLWFTNSCPSPRSRSLHLHQLQPGCSDRTAAAAAGGAGPDHFAERFSSAAEKPLSSDFFHFGLEINPTRRQTGTVRFPALYLGHRSQRRALGSARDFAQ